MSVGQSNVCIGNRSNVSMGQSNVSILNVILYIIIPSRMYSDATPFGQPNLCPTMVTMSTPRDRTSTETLPNDWARGGTTKRGG